MPHHCPIPNCFAVIKPWALMCFAHWRMVPTDLQNNVNHHNRFFKGKPIHLKACREAIDHVLTTIETAQKARAAAQTPLPPKQALPYRDD